MKWNHKCTLLYKGINLVLTLRFLCSVGDMLRYQFQYLLDVSPS